MRDSKTNTNISNSIGVGSSNSVRRPKSKDTKSKNRVLKNTSDKSSSAYVRKTPSTVRINSNKRETMNSAVIQLILWIVDSGCSKHMTGNLKLLRNFIEKFHGNSTRTHLFSVRQFCNRDLEVAFRSNTCYVQNLKGDALHTSSCESYLYTISIFELAASSPNRSLVHTRYNKTPYELIRGRKSNAQNIHVLRSLCYPTNDRVDLGKMKLKANIGIFIGYFESSRGFRIYNHRTKKIMETIHVKFDEFTTMASECNNSRPGLNCSKFENSSKELNEIPSQQDLDNLFGPLYEEYYAPRTFDVSDNSVANTLDNEDTRSSSSIIVEDSDAS
nr:retrovirus-related Pol polyprotein from transposon TNT 1-94 [Tanacetum cinerariifolium]